MTNADSFAPKAKKGGCTRAYTWEEIQGVVRASYDQKRSLRRVAKETFSGLVTHATVARIMAGKEPTDREIRRALGMVDLIPTVPCSKCGKVHVSKRCTTFRRLSPRIFDWPVADLRRALINREEV